MQTKRLLGKNKLLNISVNKTTQTTSESKLLWVVISGLHGCIDVNLLC